MGRFIAALLYLIYLANCCLYLINNGFVISVLCLEKTGYFYPAPDRILMVHYPDKLNTKKDKDA